MSSGLEAARQELSALEIKVSNDRSSGPCDSLKLPSLSEFVAAYWDEKSLHRATQIADCSLDSFLTSTEIPGGISMVGSSHTALKKRPRPIFGEGELLAWGSDARQGTQWMTSSIGWDVFSWGKCWWVFLGKSVVTSVYCLRGWIIVLDNYHLQWKYTGLVSSVRRDVWPPGFNGIMFSFLEPMDFLIQIHLEDSEILLLIFFFYYFFGI